MFFAYPAVPLSCFAFTLLCHYFTAVPCFSLTLAVPLSCFSLTLLFRHIFFSCALTLRRYPAFRLLPAVPLGYPLFRLPCCIIFLLPS